MPGPDPNESKEEEKERRVKQDVLKALQGSERFTPEERKEIAETIESEVAKLLPELPEGIAEIVSKAMGLAIGAADRLVYEKDRCLSNSCPRSEGCATESAASPAWSGLANLARFQHLHALSVDPVAEALARNRAAAQQSRWVAEYSTHHLRLSYDDTRHSW
jgi:hypothetical protein